MSHAILTIIVPTYNRATNLDVLLSALRSELRGLESLIEVLVSDNASTDSTPEVTAAAASECPGLNIQRHDINIGPEGNFLSCVPRVSTRYFWIIGDDDCPKRGVLAKVVQLLTDKKPALLYMQSEWVDLILGPDQGEKIDVLKLSELSAIEFAKALHVWTTFISGMVIDKNRLSFELGDHSINRFDDTSLVQLGWVLPLLKSEGPFLYVSDRCVLATKENSGGYPLLTVFGVNFPKIAKEVFGEKSKITYTLINESMINNLPGRIWRQRKNPQKAYSTENPWPQMHGQLKSYILYWILIFPLMKLPRFSAFYVYLIWRAGCFLKEKGSYEGWKKKRIYEFNK